MIHNIWQVARSVGKSDEAQSGYSNLSHRIGSGTPWHVTDGDAVGDSVGLSDGVAVVGELEAGATVGSNVVGVLVGIEVGGHASQRTGQA